MKKYTTMKTRSKPYLLLFFVLFLVHNKVASQSIYTNQIGYTPTSVKKIFVSGDVDIKTFKIINVTTGKVIFSGELSDVNKWSHSGTSVRSADFTGLQEKGKYELLIGKSSRKVNIDANIYEPLGVASLKSYYYARASSPLTEKFAGIYARPAGHPDDQVIIHASAASSERAEGSTIASPGGWYDAGDYNKYIVNSGITVYTLLQLYELFPAYCNDLSLNIPESTNQIPDILDETLVNLRWMLTMQDPNDGGVYHKLTSKKFCGMVNPDEDKLERYVVAKTTAATLDFAAVAAKSSRIFAKFEKELPGLADSCLVAAKDAWKWTQKHPDILYVQPKDIATGAYGDQNIEDEKYWAANELFLTTGDKKYLKDINRKMNITAPHWSKVDALGDFSWLVRKVNGDIKLHADEVKMVKEKLLRSADKYYDIYKNSAFKVSIDSFAWGSNSDLANQGVLLIHAYKVSGKLKYLEAAEACLNYILGANPLDMCFITGFGMNSPMHIHDRRCSADGIEEPIPGLLVGGPTTQARNDCGEDKYTSTYPAMSYLDMECSYATNEIAINWNAPLAFLVNSIHIIKNENKNL